MNDIWAMRAQLIPKLKTEKKKNLRTSHFSGHQSSKRRTSAVWVTELSCLSEEGKYCRTLSGESNSEFVNHCLRGQGPLSRLQNSLQDFTSTHKTWSVSVSGTASGGCPGVLALESDQLHPIRSWPVILPSHVVLVREASGSEKSGR